ncbi:MAG: glycosyltransferase family 2 protein [Acidobacteriota bacterium]
MTTRNPISVLILTCNEQQDLPACLDSVAWCDDIHILDSGSTDRTAEIATARGAIVTTRPFDTFAAQRNASLQLPFKHTWVLILDADERPTPELSAEMQRSVASAPANVAAFRMRRRDFLWGTWLKHAQMTPFYVRLLKLGHAHYERDVNEVVRIDGDIANLDSPLDHLAFSKGLSHWVTKHNAYSTTEATLLANGDATKGASLWQALFARNFHERRFAQKAIFYSLPLRPFIKWGYMMFIRGAILDGHAGAMYATLHAFYEYLIEVKRREILRQRANLPS